MTLTTVFFIACNFLSIFYWAFYHWPSFGVYSIKCSFTWSAKSDRIKGTETSVSTWTTCTVTICECYIPLRFHVIKYMCTYSSPIKKKFRNVNEIKLFSYIFCIVKSHFYMYFLALVYLGSFWISGLLVSLSASSSFLLFAFIMLFTH